MNNYIGVCNKAIKIDKNQVIQNDITKTKYDFYFDGKTNRQIELSFSFPAIDIVGMWHPACKMERDLKSDWFKGMDSMLSISAPVICLYNNESENVHTIALSETRQRLEFACGIKEENGNMIVKINLTLPDDSFKDMYSITIWESIKKEPYYQTLDEVRKFWESKEGYKALDVPQVAKESLYSFWYSYHQDVTAQDVEKESLVAFKLGFSTIIVDDGWQTEDNHRGYAYCGDWKPSSIKFPDFPSHIKRVQEMGLKYMIWFSVPFVGKNADCFDTFKDYFLCYLENMNAGVLDIRYKFVRDYLIGIYKKAVQEWGVDGLKLDFIDDFYLRDNSPSYNEKMDHRDVQDALSTLLSDIISTLKQIKPDLLIEFRQRYIGPEIRQYGNMLRVSDCPGSSLFNRVGSIDLRLLSGSTAIHSDMLMWHEDEKVENAAIQVLSCLFTTIQISISLLNMREDIKEMLEYWLSFKKKHQILLQETMIEPMQPQNLYPVVHVENKEIQEEILVSYSKCEYLNMNHRQPKFYYVNAGGECDLLVECKENRKYSLKDCMGHTLEQGILKEYTKIHCLDASLLIFE